MADVSHIIPSATINIRLLAFENSKHLQSRLIFYKILFGNIMLAFCYIKEASVLKLMGAVNTSRSQLNTTTQKIFSIHCT